MLWIDDKGVLVLVVQLLDIEVVPLVLLDIPTVVEAEELEDSERVDTIDALTVCVRIADE